MPTRIYLAEILQIVARRYGMEPADLKRHTNERETVEPRHVAMYLAREISGASLKQIGIFYDQHHTTVFHAHQKMRARRAANAEFAQLMESIIGELRALRAA